MAQHGLATIGINAVGHGLVARRPAAATARGALLAAVVHRALLRRDHPEPRARPRTTTASPTRAATSGRATSSTRATACGSRCSTTSSSCASCARSARRRGRCSAATRRPAGASPRREPCDVNGDGKRRGRGRLRRRRRARRRRARRARIGTWGESLGGILSGIHGAIDAIRRPPRSRARAAAGSPTSASAPSRAASSRRCSSASGARSLVTVPGRDAPRVHARRRPRATTAPSAPPDQLSLRWVMPDVNGTGELEIGCFDADELADTTVLVHDLDDGERQAARASNDAGLVRVGLPASIGDEVRDRLLHRQGPGRRATPTCKPTFPPGHAAGGDASTTWGKGAYPRARTNDVETDDLRRRVVRALPGPFLRRGRRAHRARRGPRRDPADARAPPLPPARADGARSRRPGELRAVLLRSSR